MAAVPFETMLSKIYIGFKQFNRPIEPPGAQSVGDCISSVTSMQSIATALDIPMEPFSHKKRNLWLGVI
jgi:hypothetical protein